MNGIHLISRRYYSKLKERNVTRSSRRFLWLFRTAQKQYAKSVMRSFIWFMRKSLSKKKKSLQVADLCFFHLLPKKNQKTLSNCTAF